MTQERGDYDRMLAVIDELPEHQRNAIIKAVQESDRQAALTASQTEAAELKERARHAEDRWTESVNQAAELKARVEVAHAAINALCRVLGPVGMTLAQQECIGEPLPREAVILVFMGSGASDRVTVGEFEDAMELARQTLGTPA